MASLDLGLLGSMMGFISSSPDKDADDNIRDDLVPGMPLLVPCAIVLWISTALVYISSETVPEATKKMLISALAIASIASLTFFLLKRHILLLFMTFALIGSTLGFSASYLYSIKSNAPFDSGEYTLQLREDPKSGKRGFRSNAICFNHDGTTSNIKIFFKDEPSIYDLGLIKAKCRFSVPSEDFKHINYMSNIHYQADIQQFEEIESPFPLNIIHGLRSDAIELFSEHCGDQAGILQALVCGYRTTIQQEGLYDAYKSCGIAHLVAVSGAHLSIIAMALGAVLSFLKIPRIAYVSIMILFIGSYLIFTGMPISAIRAAIMCSLAMLSIVAKRRSATLNSLAVSVIIFILIDPSSSVSISLFLSAASTFGIVLFGGIFSSWANKRGSIVRGLLASPLSMTISSNILTLPFAIATFGILPIIAPVSNVLISPFFTIATVFGMAFMIASLAFPAFSSAFMSIISFLAIPLNDIAQVLSKLPHSSISIDVETFPMLALSAVATLFIYVCRPKVPGFAILASTILAFCISIAPMYKISPTAENRIVMLDVGQGDAFVIQSGESSLLIDTGNERDKLRLSLDYADVVDIDAVCISHSDNDHCGSLSEIESISNNAKFLCSRYMLECRCRKCEDLVEDAKRIFGEMNLIGLDKDDSFKIGKFLIKLIWPNNFTDKGGNSDSACLYVSLDLNEDGINDWSALFTGDAESKEIEKMIKGGSLGRVDVLKVGHHGSREALSEEIIDSLDPEIALISCGEDNSYGHPSKETLEIIQNSDIDIARTDEDGVVEIGFAENAISVAKQKSTNG